MGPIDKSICQCLIKEEKELEVIEISEILVQSHFMKLFKFQSKDVQNEESSQKSSRSWLILSNPTFLIVSFAFLIGSLGIYGIPFFFLPDLLVEKGYTKEVSSIVLSALGKHARKIPLFLLPNDEKIN